MLLVQVVQSTFQKVRILSHYTFILDSRGVKTHNFGVPFYHRLTTVAPRQ